MSTRDPQRDRDRNFISNIIITFISLTWNLARSRSRDAEKPRDRGYPARNFRRSPPKETGTIKLHVANLPLETEEQDVRVQFEK